MADLIPYFWIVRLAALVGGFILANQAARGLATVLRRDATGPQAQHSLAEQLGLAGLRCLATCLCFAAVFTATSHEDSGLSWLLRVAMTAPYLMLLVGILVAFLTLVHLISDRLQRQSRPYARTHGGTRRTRPSDWHGSAVRSATGLPMFGAMGAAGSAYATGSESTRDDWHADTGFSRDADYAGTTAWHTVDDQHPTTFEPAFESNFDSTIHGSDTTSWSGADSFAHDYSSGDSMTSSTSHYSHDDWSNAWGTAADFQIPAESNFNDPTHDYTSTTYGNDSWDHDSSFSSSSSSWD